MRLTSSIPRVSWLLLQPRVLSCLCRGLCWCTICNCIGPSREAGDIILHRMPRHSKLQIQILNLYREFLRLSRNKPGIQSYARKEFRKNASLPKTDVIQIEYLYRKGVKQLNMLKSSSVTNMGVFEKDEVDIKKHTDNTEK